MKKLFIMLLFLFIIYLGLEFLFTYFGKGENFSYEIKNNDLLFGINEQSTFRIDNNDDNYYYKMNVNNQEFLFQINHNFNKRTQVITNVEYFKNNNYECILPIFVGNTILMDILCHTKNEMTYYHNLIGKDQDLDRFANGIDLYNLNNWQDKASYENIENINVYIDNLIEDHYIGFTNYRGIYNVSKNFNSKVYDIALYKHDERNQKIGAFYNQYYISADYNEEYEFNGFNLVNLTKLNTYTFASDKKISFDSYIQGIVDGELYLYDKDSKQQYKININKQTVSNINSSKIQHYEDGYWTTITLAEANKETKFKIDNNDYQNDEYARIDKIGNETGYYYLYLKDQEEYKVYRMNIQDKNDLVYLFNTNSTNNIYYVNNYIYFITGRNIKVYNDAFGVKNVIDYNELEFNQNINFAVYME